MGELIKEFVKSKSVRSSVAGFFFLRSQEVFSDTVLTEMYKQLALCSIAFGCIMDYRKKPSYRKAAALDALFLQTADSHINRQRGRDLLKHHKIKDEKAYRLDLSFARIEDLKEGKVASRWCYGNGIYGIKDLTELADLEEDYSGRIASVKSVSHLKTLLGRKWHKFKIKMNMNLQRGGFQQFSEGKAQILAMQGVSQLIAGCYNEAGEDGVVGKFFHKFDKAWGHLFDGFLLDLTLGLNIALEGWDEEKRPKTSIFKITKMASYIQPMKKFLSDWKGYKGSKSRDLFPLQEIGFAHF